MWKQKNIVQAFFLLVIISLCFPSFLFAWKGKVTKIINGDTFDVINEDNETKRVHLYGISIPKDGGLNKKKAINFVNNISDFGWIDLIYLFDIKSQKRNEVLAYTLPNNAKCINEELILNGLATVDRKHCKSAICDTWKLMEQEARTKNFGETERSDFVSYRWKKGRNSRIEKLKNTKTKQIYIVDKENKILRRENIVIN